MDKLRPASTTPLVDVFRKHPSLGWSEYDSSFINVVWDIPGDHFSILEDHAASTAKAVEAWLPDAR